ncbi:MAG: hypothetical protein ACKVQU_18045 [Burkholderiales bacterium]
MIHHTRESTLASVRHSQFEALVRAFSADLYRYAYVRCRERFTAEDWV